MTKIYVTKYVCTEGVFTVDAELKDGWAYGPRGLDMWRPRDFALTEEDARKQFDEKVAKKLASINRQLKKLAALKFSVPER